MPFDTGIPTKEGFPKVTAEQIAAGFKEFLAIVNVPIEIYRNTKANSVFLINKVFENSGTDALIFGGSYLEAFHLYAAELPDQVQSPEEKLRAAKEAEIDRAVQLEARDREGGRPLRYVNAEDMKKAEQKAFEKTQEQLKEKFNTLQQALTTPPPTDPTIADAFEALKAIPTLDRASLISWMKAFPTKLVYEVRRFPFDAKKGVSWGTRIDEVFNVR